MKNFTGMGNRATLTAAAVTASGQPPLIGSLFGIAKNATETGLTKTRNQRAAWQMRPCFPACKPVFMW